MPDLPWPIVSSQRVGELRSLAIDAAGHCFGIALLPIAAVEDGTPLSLESGEPVTVLGPCHA